LPIYYRVKPPSRFKNSEYLAQTRKGRKEIKLPALAFLASWREQIAAWVATGHRKICASAKTFNYNNSVEYILDRLHRLLEFSTQLLEVAQLLAGVCLLLAKPLLKFCA